MINTKCRKSVFIEVVIVTMPFLPQNAISPLKTTLSISKGISQLLGYGYTTLSMLKAESQFLFFFSMKGGENLTVQNEAKIQDKTDTILCPLRLLSRVIHV